MVLMNIGKQLTGNSVVTMVTSYIIIYWLVMKKNPQKIIFVILVFSALNVIIITSLTSVGDG